MAIRSSSSLSNGAYYEMLQGQVAADPVSAHNYYRFSGDPAPFRPTGKGLGIKNPNLKAVEWNANAVLINHGAGNPSRGSSYLKKLYLFVDSVGGDWEVSGDFTQAAGARTFYPKNMHQGDITITGTVANQNEYDKLATFVQHSHSTAIHGALYEDDWQNFIDFIMFRPYTKSGSPQDGTYNYWPDTNDGRINWGVILTNVDAGAERFQFAKQFVLTAKVIDDRTDTNRDALFSLADIPLTEVFGDFTSTHIMTAGTTPKHVAPASAPVHGSHGEGQNA